MGMGLNVPPTLVSGYHLPYSEHKLALWHIDVMYTTAGSSCCHHLSVK